MEQWSDGIFLLGQYGKLQAGCWLLTHDHAAAILEMPPHEPEAPSPAQDAVQAAKALDVEVRYITCSHFHGDHISGQTAQEMAGAFRNARYCFHRSAAERFKAKGLQIEFYDDFTQLDLDGEPLFLIHAPKHSWTDQVIIFRGVALMGDWELNSIRSAFDGKGSLSVPLDKKLESIDKLIKFCRDRSYWIHKVYSSHGHDRREGVDFIALMEDTKLDRELASMHA